MAVTRNLRDGSIIIKDGSGSPKTLTIPISEGDFAFTVNKPTFVVMNRGVIDSRKSGDQTPTDISFSSKFEQWSYASGASTGLSVRDVIDGTAAAVAAGWVSTDACGPWSVTIEFRIADPCNAGHYEALTFSKFHADSVQFKEGNEYNTLSLSGRALVPEPARTYV